MQVYAFDRDGKKVFVGSALSGQDYLCPECKGHVRLRRGLKRKIHFFHRSSERNCRLAGKTVFHIAVQDFIQKSIGAHNCDQEVLFTDIGRIADIAWYSKKIVIEVQCSFISAQEVEARCHAYESIGWKVVWILHERTFTPLYPTEAELFLKNRTHYYTDIDEEQGSIYDQCVPALGGHFPVDISTLDEKPALQINILPLLLLQRFTSWQYSASGDLLWQALQNNNSLLEALWRFEKKSVIPFAQKVKQLYSSIFLGIRSLWYLVVEAACRR